VLLDGDLLAIVMCRSEKPSTLITSNRRVEDWGKLLSDTAAVTAPPLGSNLNVICGIQAVAIESPRVSV
jgi:hypothetical protein